LAMMMTLHFQWEELIDIDIAKVSTSRKYSRLMSLTFDASFFFGTRLNREITSAVCGWAFKTCKDLKRML
jgi:hypothetical protein